MSNREGAPLIYRILLTLILASALSACLKSEVEPTKSAEITANFSSIQSQIFNVTCTTNGCHSASDPDAGLILDAENSYSLLVNQPSQQKPAFSRVAPGDPDNSYLIHKLEGTGEKNRMPFRGSALPQQTIDVVRQWIADGALDDRVQ